MLEQQQHKRQMLINSLKNIDYDIGWKFMASQILIQVLELHVLVFTND